MPTTPLSSNAASNLAQGSNTIFIPPSSPGSYSASPQQPQGNSGTGTEIPKAARTKLPKLTLRRFKGDVTQFRTFWDTFESAVHSNPGLTKSDKFSYLVSLLEGFASRAIEGLPVTEENYASAVEILKNLTHPVCIARSRSTHALHSPFSGPPKIQVLSP